jgi:chemotaxis protein histidine kinase CheA
MSDSTALAKPPQNNIAKPNPMQESMIVRLNSLDHMLELAGQVIIVSSNLQALSRQIREGLQISHDLSEDIKDLAITSSRISSDLHNLVSEVRTVSMDDLFARFKRVARDTARRLGKAIRFETQGEQICIDKKVSEKIYDPIAHQIRNAMAHGIEDEQTRRKASKDPVGTVKLNVRSQETSTIIEISDDGGGINLEKVRNKIIENKWIDADAAKNLNQDQLLDYLFLPGFSTSEQTSNTSGRGVGLDVVRTIMNEINAEVKIKTEHGKGTVFSFILPNVTAVNISDALIVRANNMHFAFPISAVIASQSVANKDITTTTGRGRSIIYLGKILPLFDLMSVFGEPPVKSENDQVCALIVEHKSRQVAYAVSDFLNPQKIVISEFDGGIQVPGLTGTAVLSGRQMCMVVDLPNLIDQTIGKSTFEQNNIDLRRLGSSSENTSEIDQDPTQDLSANEPKPQQITDNKELPANQDTNQPAQPIEEITNTQPDSAFLKEVESMLARLNRELFDMEESPDKQHADSIFRLMHSIKGNLTMCQAEEPAGIAHKLENILEKARQEQIEVNADVFDVLFDGSAYLEEVVSAMLKSQNQPQIPDKLNTGLQKFQNENTDQPQDDQKIDIETSQVPIDTTGQFYLSSRRREGSTLYQCRIDFQPGDQPAFLVAYLILQRIQRFADVLGTLPTMALLEEGRCDSAILALISPRDTSEDIMTRLGENLKKYYGVTRFDVSSYA